MSRYLGILLATASALWGLLGGSAAAQQCKVDNVSCSVSCSVGSASLNCDGQAKSCSAYCSGKSGMDLPTLISNIFDLVRQQSSDPYATGQDYHRFSSDVAATLKALKDYTDSGNYASHGSEYSVFVVMSDGYGGQSVLEYSEPVDLSYSYRSAAIISSPTQALDELRSLSGYFDVESIVDQTAQTMTYNPGYYYRQ